MPNRITTSPVIASYKVYCISPILHRPGPGKQDCFIVVGGRVPQPETVAAVKATKIRGNSREIVSLVVSANRELRLESPQGLFRASKGSQLGAFDIHLNEIHSWNRSPPNEVVDRYRFRH